MDPMTLMMLLGFGVDMYGQFTGAQNQNSTNQANLNAQLAHQQMMTSYVNQFLQPGSNPYSDAMMKFIGRSPMQLPAGFQGVAPPGSTGAPPGYPSLPPGNQPPNNGYPGQPNNPLGPTYTPPNVPGQPIPTTNWPTGADPMTQYPGLNRIPSRQSTLMQPQGGYTGGGGMVNSQAQLPQAPPGEYDRLVADYTQRMGDPNQAKLIAGQLMAQQYGDTSGLQAFDNDPTNIANRQSRVQTMLNDPNTDPQIRKLIQDQGYGTAMDAYQMNSGQKANPFTNFQATPRDQSGSPYGPSIFAQSGDPFQLGGAGAVPDRLGFNRFQLDGGTGPGPSNYPQGGGPGNYPVGPTDSTPWIPSNTPPIGMPQTGGPGTGDDQTMYRYTPSQGFTYDPSQIAGINTQGFNTGQDAMLQLMRSNPGGQATREAGLDTNLLSLGKGDSAFDNSDLFKALAPIDQRGLDEQVAGLHASAGSLGQRFGTAMNEKEALLRSNIQNQTNARNAQIQSSSFENAQARRMQALGLSSGRESMFNQLPLQYGNLNLGAASAYGNMVGQREGLNLQGQMANAGYANQAGQFNAGQRQMADQFNAGQGNIWNQTMLGAMSQAGGMQQNQNQYNAGLLGILNGVGVPMGQPSAWPGAISDIGSSLGFLPYLIQMMRQK